MSEIDCNKAQGNCDLNKSLLPIQYKNFLANIDATVLKNVYDDYKISKLDMIPDLNYLVDCSLFNEFEIWLSEENILNKSNLNKSNLNKSNLNKSNLNKFDDDSYSIIIHKAIDNEDFDTIKIALESGFDINSVAKHIHNNEQYTPLDYYLKRHIELDKKPFECVEFVKFLCENGAKTSKKTCRLVWKLIVNYETMIRADKIFLFEYHINNIALDEILKCLKIKRRIDADPDILF